MNAALGQKKTVMMAWFIVVAVAAGQFFMLAIGGREFGGIKPIGIGLLVVAVILARFVALAHNWARYTVSVLALAWGGLFFYRAVLYVLHYENFIWGLLQGVGLTCCLVVAGVLLFSKDVRTFFRHPEWVKSHDQRQLVRKRR